MAFSMFSQSSYWKQSDKTTQKNYLRDLDDKNYKIFDLDIEETDKWESRNGSPRKHIYGTASINGGKHRVIIRVVNGERGHPSSNSQCVSWMGGPLAV